MHSDSQKEFGASLFLGKERRPEEFQKRPAQKFNGYADQVAGLYAGMDLRKNI